MLFPAAMASRWHQFWLLLCTLGLWWWGIHQPPPAAPTQGTVLGQVFTPAGRSYASVMLEAANGQPAQVARLQRPGLRHEPGQRIAVYAIAQEPGLVDEWTGLEWPWLGWLGALALAHLMALLGCGRAGRPRLRGAAALGIVLCWLGLLWVVVVPASQERVQLLLDGVHAEAVVVDHETIHTSSGRYRAKPHAIVHFVARAASPPRDVQISTGTHVGRDGERIRLLYRPDAPTRVLLVGDQVWTAWLLPVGSLLATLLLTLGWLGVHWRRWRGGLGATP